MSRKEIYVALTLLAGAAVWLFTPAVAQRAWLGIPNAADVLSNLAFVAVGVLGLYRLQQGQRPLEAKIAESGDVFVWHATREMFAGHAVKHLAAAMGGLALANALRQPGRTRRALA